MTTIKDMKDRLNVLLCRLNDFEDTDEVIIELDDNCGGSYWSDINDFYIDKSRDGKKVMMYNF